VGARRVTGRCSVGAAVGRRRPATVCCRVAAAAAAAAATYGRRANAAATATRHCRRGRVNPRVGGGDDPSRARAAGGRRAVAPCRAAAAGARGGSHTPGRRL